MTNEIFKTDRFAIEVVSTGEFLDDSPVLRGSTLTVQTFTIRLNRAAMTAWLDAQESGKYERDEVWQAWNPGKDRAAYRAGKEARRASFETNIANALKIDRAAGSFCIIQVVSEIFTVVHMRENKAPVA